MTPYELGAEEFLEKVKLSDIHQLLDKEGDPGNLELYLLPMLPLTSAERRKHMLELKAKKVVDGHAISETAGVMTRKNKRKELSSKVNKPGDSGGADVDVVDKTAGETIQTAAEMIEASSSAKSKKQKIVSKGGSGGSKPGAKGKSMEEEVKKLFWHRDFEFRKYVDEYILLPSLDMEASYHGNFYGLVEDVGLSALRSLLLLHAMERKYDVLEEQSKHFSQDADKYKHKATTVREKDSAVKKLAQTGKVKKGLCGCS